MSWTQADLDAFDAELKKRGSLTSFSSISGESMSWTSPGEAMAYRAKIAALVASDSGTTPPRNIRYVVTDKGA